MIKKSKKIGDMKLIEILDKIDLRNTTTSKLVNNLIIFLILDILFFASIGKILGTRSLVAYTCFRIVVLSFNFVIISICALRYFYKIVTSSLYLFYDFFNEEDDEDKENNKKEYINFKKSVGSLILLGIELFVVTEAVLPTLTRFRNGLFNSDAKSILIGLLLIEILTFMIKSYACQRAKILKFISPVKSDILEEENNN